MQVAKVRGLGRLLVTLVLVFSSSAFATEYYWNSSRDNPEVSPHFTTSSLACKSIHPAGGTWGTTSRVLTADEAVCIWGCATGWCDTSVHVYRHIVTEENNCTTDSKAFHLSPTGLNRASTNDSFPSGNVSPTQTSVCSGSCSYSYSGGGNVTCGSLKGGDPLVQYCLFSYTGTGSACAISDAPINLGNTPPVPPVDPDDPTDPANNCGHTHVWSGSTCVAKLDPATPSDNSGGSSGNNGSDGNGGSDGSGGSNGGSDGGEGNGSGNGAGNGSGGGSGGGAATDVSGVEDRLDKLWNSFFEGQYNNEGDGNDADTQNAAADAANNLADRFGSKGESVLAERLEESQDYLDALPNTVTGWFGASGEAVGLYRVLDALLPSATACNDYTLNLNLGRYNANLILPTCQLTRVKPLLEYVIWCITIVGLWRILYSGLRQEDAKAHKGGF